MKAYANSKTLPEDRDKRATPPELVTLIQATLGVQFIRDVCAEPHTAKAMHYWTERDDALALAWGDDYHALLRAGVDTPPGVPAFFMNPPYSKPGVWCEKAGDEAERRVITVGVLPDDRSTRWYQQQVSRAAVVYITDKRIPFLDANGVPQFGNPKPTAIPIWTPWGNNGHPKELYLHIPDELIRAWRAQVNNAKKQGERDE